MALDCVDHPDRLHAQIADAIVEFKISASVLVAGLA